MTQTGASLVTRTPARHRARVMIPIVFWASFEPWAKAMIAGREDLRPAEPRLAIGLRFAPGRANTGAIISAKAIANPRSGEVTIGMRTLLTIPSTLSAPVPAATIVAPSRPPIRAWLLELGRPCCQVIRFQAIAPMSAAARTAWVVVASSTRPGPDRLGDRGPGEGPDEVERGGHQDRVARGERPGRDRRGDRVRGVVEPVDVVEDDRQQHDDDEHGGDAVHPLAPSNAVVGLRGGTARGAGAPDRVNAMVTGRTASVGASGHTRHLLGY